MSESFCEIDAISADGAVSPSEQLSRRSVLRMASLAGALAVPGANFLLGSNSAEAATPASAELQNLLASDPASANLMKAAAEEHEESKEPHGPSLVDWLGAANFVAGIRALMPGGRGHIDKRRYGMLSALLTWKYSEGNAEEKKHLNAEFKSVAMSGAIIEGTILSSEALKMDFAEAYKSIVGSEQIDPRDTIPLLTMFASATSPVVTTVGSSGILSKQAQSLAHELSAVREESVDAGIDQIFDADKKAEVYRILTAHVSNLSGFWLAGDPPFIAMWEKYGFVDTMIYQAHACLPLAIQSLYSANQKLHQLRLEAEGVTGTELQIRSRAEALSGLKRNSGVLAKMMGSSVANFGRILALHGYNQKDRGIQFDFTGMAKDKINGVIDLISKEHIEAHEAHEETGTRVYDINHKEETEALVLSHKIFGDTPEAQGLDDNSETLHVQKIENAVRELTIMIDKKDYEAIKAFAIAQGVNEDDAIKHIDALKAWDFIIEHDDFAPLDGNGDGEITRRRLFARLVQAPGRLGKRVTTLDRVKHALGHASADVLNVFPFQALSVPFLVPIFRLAVDKTTKSLEKSIANDKNYAGMSGEQIKELAVANAVSAMIVIMSGVADNYVAAKIGLELFPDKPHYPLIAAITGGRMTAIGNMANPTLVPLSEYGMADSIKKMKKHLPSVLFSLGYANLLELAKGTPGFPTPPKPNAAAEAH